MINYKLLSAQCLNEMALSADETFAFLKNLIQHNCTATTTSSNDDEMTPSSPTETQNRISFSSSLYLSTVKVPKCLDSAALGKKARDFT